MKGYEKYKISKFQWFDEIPEHWIEGKIKYLFEISRGRVISQLEVKPEAKFPVYSSQTKNDGCLGYIDTFDYEGEMLTWTTDGANAGSVFQRKGQFNCTNVCGILTPNKELELRYYFYYVDFIAQFYKRPDTNGAKIMSNEMAEIHCFIPSLEEQTAIASFLDYKTNLIDATIEKKKRLIELLKEKRQAVINEAVTKGLNPNATMNDSGVEWLGEIPEHWACLPLRRICSLQQGLQIPINDRFYEEIENSYEYITTKSIHNPDDFRQYILNPNTSVICNENDVLMGRTGNTGEIVTNVKGVFHNNFFKIDFDRNKFDKDFFVNYLNFTGLQKTILLVAGTTTIPDINHGAFLELSIPLPPINEQVAIVNFINEKTAIVDSLLIKNKELIEKLQTYRQSLISEAVTGKIDVREWQV
jgi:type I restriction enzyme S subunit